MKVGEILEASTSEFLAECYELNVAPPFGSLVKTKVDNIEVFALVQNIGTASREPGRLPTALGKHENTEEEIFSSHPQLTKLLRTCFKALVVGYQEGDSIKHSLPPKTACIHSFVFRCDENEIRKFCHSFDFLLLMAASRTEIPVEELIAASLRQMSLVQQDPETFLINAGKRLVLLYSGDYNRLNHLLRSIKI